jgi:proteasome lid subunit RPN8/RPN11
MRTITDKQGVVWAERDLGPHRIERTRISPVFDGGGIVRPGPMGPTGARVEGGWWSRSAATTGRPLPKFYPELEPTYEASITSSATQAIREEIRRIVAVCRSRNIETGGWLLSDPDWPDRIVLATDPGEENWHERTSVQLDLARAAEYEETFPHLRLRGDWHLHPSGDPIPSETDRRAWATGCKRIGGWYVGIIATPGESYLSPPTLNAWVTTPTLCERLYLEER